MWVSKTIIDEVDRAARIFFIDMTMTARWNEHRRADEPRLMGGWAWEAKVGGESRTGIRSLTAAYIDAWYALIQKTEAPTYRRRRLQVVASRRAA
jgi:hypothetical protein